MVFYCWYGIVIALLQHYSIDQPILYDPTDELVQHKLVKNYFFKKAIMKRCQNMHCFPALRIWGRVAMLTRPLLKAPTISMRTGPWSNKKGWPSLMNYIFFHIMMMAWSMCIFTYIRKIHDKEFKLLSWPLNSPDHILIECL